MNELLSADLVRLKQEAEGPRLSLFLPLSPGSPRSTKTRIRAKNVLAKAPLFDFGVMAQGAAGP